MHIACQIAYMIATIGDQAARQILIRIKVSRWSIITKAKQTELCNCEDRTRADNANLTARWVHRPHFPYTKQ